MFPLGCPELENPSKVTDHCLRWAFARETLCPFWSGKSGMGIVSGGDVWRERTSEMQAEEEGCTDGGEQISPERDRANTCGPPWNH